MAVLTLFSDSFPPHHKEETRRNEHKKAEKNEGRKAKARKEEEPHKTGLVQFRSISLLKQIHALVTTNGYLSKSVMGCKLVGYYGCLLGHEHARKVFDDLPKRTSRTYNCMFQVYADARQYRLALDLYRRIMYAENIVPDAVTYSLVVRLCADLGVFHAGMMVHCHAVVSGVELDLHLMTDLVNLYIKDGCIYDAKKMFDMIPRKDIVAWTAMIDGYLRCGQSEEAMGLFLDMRNSGLKPNVVAWNVVVAGFAQKDLVEDTLHQLRSMQMDGVRPDIVSLFTILPMFARVAILRPGLETHAYAMRNGFELDLFIVTALVDMYGSCGRLSSARYLFEGATLKDTGLWNAVIIANGIHGESEEVLRLFYRMRDLGCEPNEITFTAVLSACSHSGQTDEGREIFDLMVHEYRSVSNEHYTCMVDMFGRAGKLTEALEFIKKMPNTPHKDVWGSLMSSCRTHSNLDLAEIAMHRIRANIKDDAGYHVMMSNIYAGTSQWNDMARMRVQMRESRLKKKIGLSWIEIDSIVHVFTSSDTSHPHSDKIYALLRHLEDSTCSTIDSIESFERTKRTCPNHVDIL